MTSDEAIEGMKSFGGWDQEIEVIERLLAFVRERLCECHDEYGRRKPAPCERCQLLYGYETWARFDAERREGLR